MEKLKENNINRVIQKEISPNLTAYEKSLFAYLNPNLGWIGIVALPWCSSYASDM